MAQKRARSPSIDLVKDGHPKIQTLTSPLSLSQRTTTDENTSTKPPTTDTNSALPNTTTKAPPNHETRLFKSYPIHDRQSIFRAIFSPLPSEYATNPKSLQKHPDFTTADHKILAWRKPSTQQSLNLRGAKSSTSTSTSTTTTTTATGENVRRICTTWSDDDGEKYAGKRLEKVLDQLGVEGVVVVARWWGGVMLGPARFTHIEECAREAVRAFLHEGKGEEPDGKRQKMNVDPGSSVSVLDDAKECDRLRGVLKDRDESVRVLRGLLGEKNKEIERLEERRREIQSGQQQPKQQYEQQADQTDDPSNPMQDKISNNSTASTMEKSTPAGNSSSPVLPADSNTTSIASSSTPTSQSKPEQTYRNLPLETLRRLEKARDTTLSWILKQIDAVEVKIKDGERAIAKLEEERG